MPYQLVALCYLVLNLYIFLHVRKWSFDFLKSRSKPLHIAFMILFWIPVASMFLAVIIPIRFPIQRFFKITSNYWLAVLIYTGVPCVLCDLANLTVRIVKKHSLFREKKVFFFTGAFIGLLTVSMCVFGHLNAVTPRPTYYDIAVDKPCENLSSLRVAVVSDTHFGYNMGLKETEKTVALINRENVDLVLFVGDIFDNEFDGIREPDRIAGTLSTLKSTYGSYACWGNHDINEVLLSGFTISWENESDDTPYLDFLDKADICVLNDESVLIDDAFYLVGRKDPMRTYKQNDSMYSVRGLLNGLDLEKPILLMDHQPKDLEAISETGVDIEFSGHTHGGQIFPGTVFIGLLYENALGMKQFGDMTSVTTAGVGAWGPYIRTGVKAEVVIADIRFE